MTALYGVSEFSPKSVLLQIRTSQARLEKRHSHSAENFGETFKIFHVSKFGTWFPDFSYHRPNKMCFGAL